MRASRLWLGLVPLAVAAAGVFSVPRGPSQVLPNGCCAAAQLAVLPADCSDNSWDPGRHVGVVMPPPGEHLRSCEPNGIQLKTHRLAFNPVPVKRLKLPPPSDDPSVTH